MGLVEEWKRQWGWNAMQYEYNQKCWMRMRWAIIYKTNEMEIKDEMNELDFGIWDEWDERWYMKWMRSELLGKYVASLSLSIWKMRNSFTFFFKSCNRHKYLIVLKRQKSLKSYQITSLQYITLWNKSSQISLTYGFWLINYTSRS